MTFAPAYKFRIVFVFCRYPPYGKGPPRGGYWSKRYLLTYYYSLRYRNFTQQLKLFPGQGRLYIVPDKYFKNGRADLT